MSKIKISVTAEDIANGKIAEAYECPISLAIGRALGTNGVGVCGSWIDLNGKHLEISELAANFVSEYDYGNFVEPFEFELEI